STLLPAAHSGPRFRRITVLVAALVLSLGIGAASAREISDEQRVVNRAKATVDEMHHDRSFGNSAELLRRAKAVMIVPRLFKGGFFVGGEGGTGVLLAKTPEGGWSYPAFYGLGSGSFGLQIGFETAEVVFFVMSDKALDAWMKNEVKLSAN